MVCFPNKFSFFSMPSVTLILILIVTVGLVVWSLQQRPQYIMMPSLQEQPQQKQPEVKVSVNTRGGDDRYTRSPEAERVWAAPPDYSRIPGPETPFNIPTQGIPESYQSMGIVKTGDGKLLPLYGRRSISARDRYNYYTRTDSYNPIPIPVNIKGRDCQDQVGCPELFNGDKVKLSATDEQGEVTIYRVRDIVR
jgi:hypothetical protein